MVQQGSERLQVRVRAGLGLSWALLVVAEGELGSVALAQAVLGHEHLVPGFGTAPAHPELGEVAV